MELRRTPEQLALLIREAHTIALCSHINPDGDTIGSALALKQGLTAFGKQVDVYCADHVPDNLLMLPGAKDYLTPDAAQGKRYDLLLCVDISDTGRMGKCQCLLNQSEHTAQIDHHGTNPAYAQVNDVDPTASATGLLAKELLDMLGIAITREISVCLYTAISTDTGNFAFSCTTSEAFRVMGELMDAGLPLAEMNRKLFMQKSKAQLLLLSRALNSVRFCHNDQITSMSLTLKDFEECGAKQEHADTVVNYGIVPSGVRMCMLARETEDGRVKVSLRALEPDRVDGIASSFGGGGHAQASGCTLDCPLEEAVQRVVHAMISALDEETT